MELSANKHLLIDLSAYTNVLIHIVEWLEDREDFVKAHSIREKLSDFKDLQIECLGE